MREVEGGVCAVPGVRADGARGEEYGVAVVEGSGPAAGVFTTNRVRAAPVKLTRGMLEEEGRLDGVVANSGNANAFTGERGRGDAEWMAELPDGRFGVASTGIIGRRIDRGEIGELFEGLEPTGDPEGSSAAADGIRTTDTFSKEFAVEGDGFRVGGIAKGSGMIEPEMGTMLAFLYTDASTDADTLGEVLRSAVRDSFNMVTVDGETSTNDCVLLTSTEEGPQVDGTELEEAVFRVCEELARMIARDGEGATKMMECRVEGAATEGDAREAAKAVARSPLVKTAAFGEEANFGRAVAALGHSGAEFSEGDLSLEYAGGGERVAVVEGGEVLDFDGKAAKRILEGEEFVISASIGDGSGEATAYGCDLTHGYVDINAAYGEGS